MRTASKAERDGFALEARNRSGLSRVLIRPITAAGTEVALCALSDVDWKTLQDGLANADDGRRQTARNIALAKARLWPDQNTFREACERIPGLAGNLLADLERVSGASDRMLSVVDVVDTLDASAIAAMAVDPNVVAALRNEYPHEGLLKIASYRDPDMRIKWACVLALPNDAIVDLALDDIRSRGYAAQEQLACACIADVKPELRAAFVRGPNRIATALFPALYMWVRTVAAERPTDWLLDSTDSATWEQPPAFSVPPQRTSASETLPQATLG